MKEYINDKRRLSTRVQWKLHGQREGDAAANNRRDKSPWDGIQYGHWSERKDGTLIEHENARKIKGGMKRK